MGLPSAKGRSGVMPSVGGNTPPLAGGGSPGRNGPPGRSPKPDNPPPRSTQMTAKTTITAQSQEPLLDHNEVLDRIAFYRYKLLTSDDLASESERAKLSDFWATHRDQIRLLITLCVEACTEESITRALRLVKPLAEELSADPTWLLTGDGTSPYWWTFVTKTQENQWQLHRRIEAVRLHRGVKNSVAMAEMIGLETAIVQQVVNKGSGATARVVPRLAEAFGVDKTWLRTGTGDAPAWFPEAQRWLRQNEGDRDVAASSQDLDLSEWIHSVRTLWSTLLSKSTAPFQLEKLPHLDVDRTAIHRQDVVHIFNARRLIQVAKCFRLKTPPVVEVAAQLERERQQWNSAAECAARLHAAMGLAITAPDVLDCPHDLPDHPAELVAGCLLVAADQTRRPRRRHDQLLRLRQLLLAQPPGPKGLLTALQAALTAERTRDPGGAVGTVLRAMVAGVCIGPDAEVAELVVKVGHWLLRTPVPGEPAWRLAELVAIHRAFQAAADRWPNASTWPSVLRPERLEALVRARAGKILHSGQLAADYRLRDLSDRALAEDLAMLTRLGLVHELLGGYWRFRD